MSGPKMDLEINQTPKSEEKSCDEAAKSDLDQTDELAAQEAERAERARRKAESRANMVEKWSHDKFDDEQQQPRSQQELVDR